MPTTRAVTVSPEVPESAAVLLVVSSVGAAVVSPWAPVLPFSVRVRTGAGCSGSACPSTVGSIQADSLPSS
jgi:hypothetical protein